MIPQIGNDNGERCHLTFDHKSNPIIKIGQQR